MNALKEKGIYKMTRKHFIAFAQYSFDAELDVLQISKLMSVLSSYNSGFQARRFLDYIEKLKSAQK